MTERQLRNLNTMADPVSSTPCRMTDTDRDDIRALLAENAESRKLREELLDMAICKIEGVAFALRQIAGYSTGPYPPLEAE